jgi:hypothetical protein
MADPWAVVATAPAQDDGWAVRSVQPTPRRSLTQDVTGFMANVNRGLGIGDEMAAGARTAGNLFAGKIGLSDVPNDFRQSMATQRQTEDSFASAHPHVAALAKGTGMAATAAVPAGNTANLFANSGRAVNAVRGATVAGLNAAGYAAVDRGTLKERAQGAARAASDPVTLALGAAGGAIATPKAAPRSATVDPAVALLAQEGVQLTPGQMRGGVAKTAEEAGTSLPFVGDAIQARRNEGVESFNRAVVNRALKPVGETLPDHVSTGSDAVKYAGDLLSKGYEAAIPSVTIRGDQGFVDDVQTALAHRETMTPDAQQRLADIVQKRILSRTNQAAAIDGRTYKQIQSELDYEVGRFSKSQDADQRGIGQALEGIQSALENAARRQDPKFAAKIDALDRGWAELGRIEHAAAKSPDLSGVFTPKQYGQSIRAGDNRVRSRGVARGEALSQDLASAGIKVLPSKIGDSGTATRSMWGMAASVPGAVLGAVTGGGAGAVAGIGGTAATLGAASRLYTPEAVAAANAALNDRLPGSSRQQALQQLAEMAAKDPKLNALRSEVAARLSRAAGVAGGSQQASRNPFAQP